MRHYNAETGLLLVRVAREHATLLRAAISLVCFVEQQAVRLTVLRAAGSVRCGRRALVEELQRTERAGGSQAPASRRHLTLLLRSDG